MPPLSVFGFPGGVLRRRVGCGGLPRPGFSKWGCVATSSNSGEQRTPWVSSASPASCEIELSRDDRERSSARGAKERRALAALESAPLLCSMYVYRACESRPTRSVVGGLRGACASPPTVSTGRVEVSSGGLRSRARVSEKRVSASSS